MLSPLKANKYPLLLRNPFGSILEALSVVSISCFTVFRLHCYAISVIISGSLLTPDLALRAFRQTNNYQCIFRWWA